MRSAGTNGQPPAPEDPVPLRAFGSPSRLVPLVGQGTWNMERDERGTVIAALQRGIDLGMNHVDTAEMYGDGRVEELLGEALREHRDDVFLVSKVLPHNASRAGTVRACERSLARLRTDRLDAYLLHWPGPHPIEETVAAFEELVEAGKIGCWGVSNFDVAELDEVLRVAGPERVACNQVLYHLGERAIEHAVLPHCREHGIAIVAYSPFGSGDFPAGDDPGANILSAVAGELGATPRQVALAFLARDESVLTIPKASHSEHVVENAGAGRLELDARAIERIESSFPLGPPRRGLPMI